MVPGIEKKASDNVSKKIFEDAYAQRDKIINDALNKEKEIIESAENRKKQAIENAENEARSAYKKVYDIAISKARSALDQEILLRKISIINNIIDESVEKIKSMGTRQYENALAEVLKSIDISRARYQIGLKERALDDKAVKKLTGGKDLKKSGQPADFDEGIKIIEDKKEFLISAEILVKERLDDINMEIAKFLF